MELINLIYNIYGFQPQLTISYDIHRELHNSSRIFSLRIHSVSKNEKDEWR